MTIAENIKQMTIESMTARNPFKTDVFRGLSAGFITELLSQKKVPSYTVTDEVALAVIKKQVKQRRDSIGQFEKGGRADLVDKEKMELEILENFLPEQMSEEEIEKIVVSKIAELNVTDMSGIGKLIGAVMKETGGNADGNVIKAIIEKKLK